MGRAPGQSLGSAGAIGGAPEISDAALALAYERWGVDGLVHLIGDWSLVLGDRARRTTILASDFAGIRPLYYRADRGQMEWSSRLKTLIDSTELDETWIRAYLHSGACPNRTPYRGIHSVPPGCAVCVSPSGTSTRRFWELPVGDQIRYRDSRRYEEQLRALFEEAVSVRLRNGKPVLAELSGGLDSSSVVCMANRLAPGHLTGLSYLWRHSLDQPFVREVEEFCGIEGIHIPTEEVPIVAEMQAGEFVPEPFQPLRRAMANAARRLGSGTILTGQGGDLMMGNWLDDSLQVAGHLRRFRPVRACAESLAWSRILRQPVYRVLWQGLRAALPPAFAPGDVHAPRNTGTSLAFAEPPGLYSTAWMEAPPERRKHFQALSRLLETRALQVPEPLQHLDYTHPFAHRPLVEFAIAIPAEVLCGPGEPRKLMRAAMADMWPSRVRARRSKGLFSVAWQEALRPIAVTLLRGGPLQVAECGLVDPAGVRSRLERLAAGVECNGVQLRQIVLLELWLRRRARAGRSDPWIEAA